MGEWIQQAEDRDQRLDFVYKIMNLRDLKRAPSSSNSYAIISFSRRILFDKDSQFSEE